MKYKLINVAKYAKLDYLHTVNIWQDLAYCLYADDYNAYYKDNAEESYKHKCLITSIISNNTYDFLKEGDKKRMLSLISPGGCYETGYYTKDHIFSTEENEYDYYEALVRFYLHILMKSTCSELGYENWDEFEKNNIPELLKTEQNHIYYKLGKEKTIELIEELWIEDEFDLELTENCKLKSELMEIIPFGDNSVIVNFQREENDIYSINYLIFENKNGYFVANTNLE